MTYGSRLRAEQADQAIGHWPGSKKLPGWLLEQIAEEKLTGGYKTKPNRKRPAKNPICPTCNVAKSINGSCTCTE